MYRSKHNHDCIIDNFRNCFEQASASRCSCLNFVILLQKLHNRMSQLTERPGNFDNNLLTEKTFSSANIMRINMLHISKISQLLPDNG